MKIVLSRDDEIVRFINGIPRAEFRSNLLFKVARSSPFSAVLDDPIPTAEDYRALHDLLIETGIPEERISSDAEIQKAAQAIMNRIMESLKEPQ